MPLRPRVIEAVAARDGGGRARDDRHGPHVRRRATVRARARPRWPDRLLSGRRDRRRAQRTLRARGAAAECVALRAYAAAKAHGYHVQFYRDDRFYVEALDRYTELVRAHVGRRSPSSSRRCPRRSPARDSTKVNIVMDRAERAPRRSNLMQRTFGDGGVRHALESRVRRSAQPARRQGRRAAIWSRERYGVPLARVLAIGDSYNDLPLLRAAGFAVAMGSAPESLKAEADAVVADVEAGRRGRSDRTVRSTACHADVVCMRAAVTPTPRRSVRLLRAAANVLGARRARIRCAGGAAHGGRDRAVLPA